MLLQKHLNNIDTNSSNRLSTILPFLSLIRKLSRYLQLHTQRLRLLQLSTASAMAAQRSIFAYVYVTTPHLPSSLSVLLKRKLILIYTCISRRRTPLILMTIFGGSAFFIGLKWRAVMQRSEEAKRSGTKDINYSVAPGRSGTFPPVMPHIPYSNIFLSKTARVAAPWYG